MSLGPFLRMGGGMPTGLSMPFGWVHQHVPYMDRLWWPERWEVLCAIALSLLAGMGVERLRAGGRLRARAARTLLVVAVAGVPALQSGHVFLNQSQVTFTDSALYEGLEGPVLSTPLFGDSRTAGLVLLAQTRHAKAMNSGLGQHLEGHRPPGFEAFVAGNGVFEALKQLERGGGISATITPEDVEDLIQTGFRSVLVDPMAYMAGMDERWAATYAAFFRAIWGRADHLAGGGAWWRIEPIPAAVTVPLNLAARPDRRLR
jgi:hypothetical protein